MSTCIEFARCYCGNGDFLGRSVLSHALRLRSLVYLPLVDMTCVMPGRRSGRVEIEFAPRACDGLTEWIGLATRTKRPRIDIRIEDPQICIPRRIFRQCYPVPLITYVGNIYYAGEYGISATFHFLDCDLEQSSTTLCDAERNVQI